MSKARDIADLGTNDVLETTSAGVDVTGTMTVNGRASIGGTNPPQHKVDVQGSSQTSPDTIGAWGDDSAVKLQAGSSNDVYSAVETVGNWDGTSQTGGRVSVYTAGTERMRVAASGNVGIGSNNPTHKVHIVPPADPTSGSSDSQVKIGEFSNNPSYGLNVGYGYMYNYGHMGSIQSIGNGSGTGLTLNPDGGTVGVGLYNPKAKLDVAYGAGTGANTNTVDSSIGISGTGTSQPILGMRWTGINQNGISGNPYVSQIVADTANNNALEMFTTGSTPIVFGTNATQAMRIAPDGNLLVGTNSIYGTNSRINVLGKNSDTFAVGISGNNTATGAPLALSRSGTGDSISFYNDWTGSGAGHIGVEQNYGLNIRTTNQFLGIHSGTEAGLYVMGSLYTGTPRIDPATDNYYDLGEEVSRFKNLYLRGTSYSSYGHACEDIIGRNITGTFSANTWINTDITRDNITAGVYIAHIYMNTYNAGISMYDCHAVSEPFRWSNTASNSNVSSFVSVGAFMGHAPNSIPQGNYDGTLCRLRIVHEFNGVPQSLQIIFPQHALTNLSSTSGYYLSIALQRIA